jgi:sodium/proline symporter
LVAYTIYSASSIKACGTLFNTVTGLETEIAMYLAASIIIAITFLGGFSAVCWTDFLQALLIFGAMLIAPLFAYAFVDASKAATIPAEFWNPMSSWKDIVSGLGWGLGYFGMPHIIVRFMSLNKQSNMKKSATIAVAWTTSVVVFAGVIGVVGRMFLGFDETINGNSLVFITMVRTIFPALLSGLLLSAVLAASLSTADSQLLAAASSFASDVYKPILRNNKVTDKEMLWAGRIVVMVVSVISVFIAASPNSGSIMSLVANAWGVFGAAFGPAIMLSLFWKRFNYTGALVGIIVGAVVDIAWFTYLPHLGIYEIIPGFFTGLVAAVLATLCTPAPSQEVEELFDKAVNYED